MKTTTTLSAALLFGSAMQLQVSLSAPLFTLATRGVSSDSQIYPNPFVSDHHDDMDSTATGVWAAGASAIVNVETPEGGGLAAVSVTTEIESDIGPNYIWYRSSGSAVGHPRGGYTGVGTSYAGMGTAFSLSEPYYFTLAGDWQIDAVNSSLEFRSWIDGAGFSLMPQPSTLSGHYSYSGILEAGDHQFAAFTSGVLVTEEYADFSQSLTSFLSMSPVSGAPVPDAGSSLGMAGVSLGALLWLKSFRPATP